MKKLIKLYWVAFLILPQILFISQIHANTYYVDRNHSSANDGNPGTLNSPWLTIQHAAETAVAGDTVYIRTGTYNETVYIDNNGNATAGDIVFSAYPGEIPVIDGTGVTDSQNGIVVARSYIKLIGLDVRNWNDNGIWIETASNIELANCVVHDVMYGIGVADGTHDFVFNQVEVHHYDLYGFDVSTSGGADCYNGTFNDCISHTGRDPAQNVDGFALGHGTQHDFVLNRCVTYNVFDGFDISAGNTRLNRCLAYDCWNGCYKLWQDNVVLINCIGYNSGVSVVELDWDGSPGTTTLINCTFFNGQTFTIWVENAGDALHMTNCILAGGDNIGLAFEQRDASNYQGDYNLFHNDDAVRAIVVGYEDEFTLDQVEASDWNTYSGQDAHSVVTNNTGELFVNTSTPDLHLTGTSVALDQGTGTVAPAEDYDGNPRPVGQGYDIGAYEYGSVGIIKDEKEGNGPDKLVLLQNYPNPFNPMTSIQYSIPQHSDPQHVSLSIYNIRGEKIRSLVREEHNSGTFAAKWDGRDDSGMQVSGGVYLCRLESETIAEIRSMLLIR